MIKYVYLILGICFGVILQTILVTVDAQTSYCDNEAYIYLINNNLEGLFACINHPDQQQDIKIEELDTRVRVVEDKQRLNNTVMENR